MLYDLDLKKCFLSRLVNTFFDGLHTYMCLRSAHSPCKPFNALVQPEDTLAEVLGFQARGSFMPQGLIILLQRSKRPKSAMFGCESLVLTLTIRVRYLISPRWLLIYWGNRCN